MNTPGLCCQPGQLCHSHLGCHVKNLQLSVHWLWVINCVLQEVTYADYTGVHCQEPGPCCGNHKVFFHKKNESELNRGVRVFHSKAYPNSRQHHSIICKPRSSQHPLQISKSTPFALQTGQLSSPITWRWLSVGRCRFSSLSQSF